MVLRNYNGECYEIVPVDGGEDNERVYVCRDEELEDA
jgi:hypothetical protein